VDPQAFHTRAALSLLDRLTDANPQARRETPLTTWEEEREFKAGLCRDLTALLNTRRALQDFDPVFEQATDSLLSFGITDFTSYNLRNSLEQDRVRLSMERAIRQFEPRLTQVEVLLIPVDTSRPVLQFQITAGMRMQAAESPVVLDATLQRDSRRVNVYGGAG